MQGILLDIIICLSGVWQILVKIFNTCKDFCKNFYEGQFNITKVNNKIIIKIGHTITDN